MRLKNLNRKYDNLDDVNLKEEKVFVKKKMIYR